MGGRWAALHWGFSRPAVPGAQRAPQSASMKSQASNPRVGSDGTTVEHLASLLSVSSSRPFLSLIFFPEVLMVLDKKRLAIVFG